MMWALISAESNNKLSGLRAGSRVEIRESNGAHVIRVADDQPVFPWLAASQVRLMRVLNPSLSSLLGVN